MSESDQDLRDDSHQVLKEVMAFAMQSMEAIARSHYIEAAALTAILAEIAREAEGVLSSLALIERERIIDSVRVPE